MTLAGTQSDSPSSLLSEEDEEDSEYRPENEGRRNAGSKKKKGAMSKKKKKRKKKRGTKKNKQKKDTSSLVCLWFLALDFRHNFLVPCFLSVLPKSKRPYTAFSVFRGAVNNYMYHNKTGELRSEKWTVDCPVFLKENRTDTVFLEINEYENYGPLTVHQADAMKHIHLVPDVAKFKKEMKCFDGEKKPEQKGKLIK